MRGLVFDEIITTSDGNWTPRTLANLERVEPRPLFDLAEDGDGLRTMVSRLSPRGRSRLRQLLAEVDE